MLVYQRVLKAHSPIDQSTPSHSPSFVDQTDDRFDRSTPDTAIATFQTLGNNNLNRS